MKAVVLAAGMGTRLGVEDPKGLLSIDGETLISRSLANLASVGLTDVSMVVGFEKQKYDHLADTVRLIDNDVFRTTSTLHSLMLAHRILQDDLIVLESDLLYEPRTLQRLIDHPNGNALVLGGISGGGDEVWVDAPDGRLRSLSKIADQLEGPVVGEYIGIAKFTRGLLDDMETILALHPTASYDGDGVVGLAKRHLIGVELIEDLVWCEVDDRSQWDRLITDVYPRYKALQTTGRS